MPNDSRFWKQATTNDSILLTWENFTVGRVRKEEVGSEQAAGTPPPPWVSAQLELFTTGDFIARSNEVETVYRRVDDFDWDGDGIVNEDDGDPYRYDSDCCGQPSWWRAHVDETVGIGRENGYYRLLARVPSGGFRRTVLSVGNEKVVVAEPGDSPQTFTAVLSDYTYCLDVAYNWTCDDGNVVITSPQSQVTEIGVSSMPNWAAPSVSVTATFGTHTLESHTTFSYGEHASPEVSLEVSAPTALLLNSNRVNVGKCGQVSVSFIPDVATNGTLTLRCVAGNDRVFLSGDCSWQVTDSESHTVNVTGIKTSESLNDVVLQVEFTPNQGASISAESSLTVVQINNAILPGAPSDGLVISTGTSVALDVAVLPYSANGLLSTVFNVRKLRADGTYTDWEYAAGNYGGTDAIYNPPTGGIYQVQAFVGVGQGAKDERYYVWDADEDRSIGWRRRGENKAFGVVSDERQKSLRNCALGYLGSIAYLTNVLLPALYGFPEYPAGDLMFKCNIFVAHRIREAGLSVPETRGLLNSYPPLANDWANVSYFIQDWTVDNSFPEPGFIVATPNNGMGHVAILDFDGYGISAGGENVNRKFKAWVPGVVKRKFTGGNR